DDGDRGRRRLRRLGVDRAARHDDVYLEPDQLGRELWKPRGVALGPAGLDQNVLAFDPATACELQPEGFPDTSLPPVSGGLIQQTDAIYLCRGLSHGGKGSRMSHNNAYIDSVVRR